MQGVDVFCERCGTPQPRPEVSAGRSPGILARRVLDAVGITESETTGAEDWLRLCLNCRGYSCPTCWNDSAGACQTCEPLPEPIVEFVPQPAPPPVAAVLPRYVAPEMPEAVFYPPAPEAVFYPPAPEPAVVAEPEPAVVAEPEPAVVAEPEPAVVAEPQPAVVAEPEPAVVAEPQSAVVAEPEPAVVAEPEPAVVAEPQSAVVAEPQSAVVAEPEPAVVAEPQSAVVAEPQSAPDPIERPAPPRMPVLPLPPPRPADAPPIPLPPRQPYPGTPQIAFNPALSVGDSVQTSTPVFEAHLLLAPPPELPPNAIAAGLRPCPNCRVTLSARAHFCRRCGTAQAH